MDLVERRAPIHSRHPWEQARAAFFVKAARKLLRPDARLLDVGAGDGFVASQLLGALPALQITCCDLHYDDATISELSKTYSKLTFAQALPDTTFDAITLLDVLAHIDDDQSFLDDLVRRITPGGILLFAVPAWQALFTAHDRKLRHFRRYSPSQALEVLRRSGLEPLSHGGLFHSLLPVRLAEKALETVKPARQDDTVLHGDVGTWGGGPLLTRAITTALELDGSLSRALSRIRLPLPGLSFFALCRKPL